MNPDVIVRAIEGNIENDDDEISCLCETLGERKREIFKNEREKSKEVEIHGNEHSRGPRVNSRQIVFERSSLLA